MLEHEFRTAGAASDYRAALAAAHEARVTLSRTLREAQEAGAKIRELEEWTGYSRRRIFQLLADDKPS